MKEIMMYVTDDGKVFENKEDAMTYEAKHDYTKVFRAMSVLKEYCKLYPCCEGCFLCKGGACELSYTPGNWKIEKVN